MTKVYEPIHLRMRLWYYHELRLSGVKYNVMFGSIHLTHIDKVLQNICCRC